MEPTLIVLKGLEGNEPTHLGSLQNVLAPHVEVLMTIWWVVFFITLASVMRAVYKNFAPQNK